MYTYVHTRSLPDALPIGTQITFGPSTGDGFYYDFAPAAGRGPFRDDELPLIEEEMRRIIAADLPLPREVWERDRLIAKWAAEGRSEEHTSELQSLMRLSYAVFFLKTQKRNNITTQ